MIWQKKTANSHSITRYRTICRQNSQLHHSGTIILGFFATSLLIPAQNMIQTMEKSAMRWDLIAAIQSSAIRKARSMMTSLRHCEKSSKTEKDGQLFRAKAQKTISQIIITARKNLSCPRKTVGSFLRTETMYTSAATMRSNADSIRGQRDAKLNSICDITKMATAANMR